MFPYLRELVVFLAAAGIVVPLFHRARLSPVLGYLLIGAAIGPHGLGVIADDLGPLRHAVISDVEGVKRIGELGVIFLLFTIGLDLSLDRLWSLRKLVFGFGSAQVLASAAVIAAVAWAFGSGGAGAVVLGMSLALSSTAIVMQLLVEGHRLATTLGRASFAVLLFQDLAVVPILAVLGVLRMPELDAVALALLAALAKAAVVVGLVLAVGRLGLRPLYRLVAATGSRELFMALTLLAALGAAALTGLAGLSMSLGAFLAGLLIAESEYQHQVIVDIEPFKGLLLGVFFLSVGMEIDARLVAGDAVWLAVAVPGLFAAKAAIAAALGRAYGLPPHVALEAGLLLGQGGEFGFVVVGFAMGLGVVAPGPGQFALVLISLSMLATPFVAALGRRLAAALERRADHRAAAGDAARMAEYENHAIVAGFGRVGQILGRVLQSQQAAFVALDVDAREVARHRSARLPVFYGDASHAELLARARADAAHTLAVTMNDPRAVERTVAAARERWPELRIYARARDAAQAKRLLELGATAVIQESVEASLQLAGRVLEGLGLPEESVDQIIDTRRAAELALREEPAPRHETRRP